VAFKRFVDNIATEVIEANLINTLHDIFSPLTVTSMATDIVADIAGESGETRVQREQLIKQLGVLTSGFETCKRFIQIRVPSKEYT